MWAFATLGWPNKKKYLKKFYPTTVLVTGFDIIFFWVARMIMFGMEFMNKEPFKDVYVHALVRDEKGQKMSKSKGNVIDPLELIEKYSADALRFTLLSMASPGRDVKLSEDRVKGYRNFLNICFYLANLMLRMPTDQMKTMYLKRLDHELIQPLFYNIFLQVFLLQFHYWQQKFFDPAHTMLEFGVPTKVVERYTMVECFPSN